MAGVYGSAPNWAHIANNVPSMLGVIGTLGTADTTGSALTLPFSVDASTGAAYVIDLSTSQSGTQPISGTVTTTSKPSTPILTYGTFGAGTIGTLVAGPGVGTSIYVTSFSIDGDITALGTPDVVLSFGTVQNGSGVIFRGGLPTNTPFGQTFALPISNNQTNAPLTFMQLAAGGTVTWNVSYFVQ
jgi:hypothetical protein